ncbi:MAG: MBOAT family O-acyltransferase [Bacteroidia bacterium]
MLNWNELADLFVHNPKEPLLFHTGFFLFIFSVFLTAYSLVVHNLKMRHLFIILFSLYFYYKASGYFVALLYTTVSLDYIFSLLITRTKNETGRKLFLLLGILFSASFLFYFKYRNFFLENLSALTGQTLSLTALILPVGISFYTFQSISYLVDVYKKKVSLPSYSDYLMYMTFFPHLVAGPIVRARDFLPQLRTPVSISKPMLNEALWLITKGLVKKAIIADFVAQYSDIVFSAPAGFSGMEHILATLCYTLQIFCDFSGYTDMAIGVALLLGYRLSLNFDSPYKSLNITDFWRRWHISLSSWLRDYIYIPMGGNRRGAVLQLLFLLLTMLIGGFWHGANWKFIFWGAGHGALLILHKLFSKVFPGAKGRIFRFFSWLLTFCCVALLWIPFRAQSVEDTWLIYGKIFSAFNPAVIIGLAQANPLLFILFFIGFVFTLLPFAVKALMRKKYDEMDFYLKVILFVIIIQVILQVRSSTVQPFIYFQF